MNLLLKLKAETDRLKIQELIERKVKRFSKYLSHTAKLNWFYFYENGKYYSEVRVSGFSGPVLQARASSANKFKVIDQAIDRIDTQLNRKFGQKKKRAKKLNHHSI